jgi:hypothetical protein
MYSVSERGVPYLERWEQSVPLLERGSAGFLVEGEKEQGALAIGRDYAEN